jgi:hypothetical protein
VIQADFHDDALFAHFHDHVNRILLGVVEDFDELDQVRVVELLHDGNLLANQMQSVVMAAECLRNTPPRSQRTAGRATGSEAGLAKDVGLCALP